jgi:urea transport system ATP-binding protein
VDSYLFEYFPILAERLDQKGGTMSGGQQQQLAIARALASEPSVLLLDEPSEGLQPNIVDRIAEVLQQVNAERGVSVLLVEQNLELALGTADRVAIMEKGAITYLGSPEEVRRSDTLVHRTLAI